MKNQLSEDDESAIDGLGRKRVYLKVNLRRR